jgi:hypothetical protein
VWTPRLGSPPRCGYGCRMRSAIVVLFAVLAVRCAEPPPASCEPGASIECACTDGRTGAQVCRTDGLGPCVCTGGAGGGATSTGGGASAGGGALGGGTATGGGTASSGGGTGSLCGACDGCCVNGVCKAGTAASACGANGEACSTCTDFQTCTAKHCSQSCDNTTCSGCCSAGSCLDGGANEACGSGGMACAACDSSQDCRAGSCVATLNVTMSYYYYANGANCPNATCVVMKRLTQVEYDAIKGDYPTTVGQFPQCTETQTTDGYSINCALNSYCGTCTCNVPAFCSLTTCGWNPP